MCRDRMKLSALHWICFAIGVLHVATLVKGREDLEITKFEVPPHVVRGDDVKMSCEHNLERGKLIEVAWYHNGNQFYRYAADEKPERKSVFENSGLNVDSKESTDTRLILLNVNMSASGIYKCKVMSEGSQFPERTREAKLAVVVIPSSKPLISPPPDSGLRIGSSVDLNCTASPSIPKADLQWAVNGKPVPEHHLRRYSPTNTSDGLLVAKLGLKFKLEKKHFVESELNLKCTAKIETYYSKSDEHSHPSPDKPKTRPTTGGANPNGDEMITMSKMMMVTCMMTLAAMWSR